MIGKLAAFECLNKFYKTIAAIIFHFTNPIITALLIFAIHILFYKTCCYQGLLLLLVRCLSLLAQ